MITSKINISCKKLIYGMLGKSLYIFQVLILLIEGCLSIYSVSTQILFPTIAPTANCSQLSNYFFFTNENQFISTVKRWIFECGRITGCNCYTWPKYITLQTCWLR